MKRHNDSARSPRSGPADLFVSRPTLGIVVNLLVLIAGIAALIAVDVREMPDVEQKVLSVRTIYEGAVAEVVDQDVTQALEDALSSLDGLTNISSSSSTGSSSITIDLSEQIDVNNAANEAREIVSQTLRHLPDGIETPVVSKNDSNADPIIRLALVGDAGLSAMTSFAEGALYEELSTIDGIAEVTVRGEQTNEYLIQVSMPELASRGLDFDDVSRALQSLRDDTPLGDISTSNQSITLRTSYGEASAERIASLAINDTTRISDIGFVEYVAEEQTSFAILNGEPAIVIEITRQSNGNTLSISKDVRAAVAEMQSSLPDNMSLVMATDDGKFIESSIREVTKSMLLATLIVISVIFMFLKSWRATVIPALTIPVALLGTLAAIWLVGFSVNTISLLALVLATGMIVDDAIVVIENIARKRQQGMGPFAAAAAGTNEVFFAVLSTTMTLAAVFIPISFLPGQAGGVFKEFGFVLAFSVAISSLAALTLAPVLAALLDPARADDTGTNDTSAELADQTAGGTDARPATGFLANLFDRTIDFTVRSPMLVLAIAGAFVIAASGAASSLTSSITPTEDRGAFIIIANGPDDATLDYMEVQAEKIEDIIYPHIESGEVAAVQTLLGRRGANSAFVIVRMADWSERDRPQQALMAELGKDLSKLTGVTVRTRAPNSLNIRGGGSGLRFAVTGNVAEQNLAGAEQLIAAMREQDIFINPQLSSSATQALMQIEVDADLAQSYGLTVQQVTSTISSLVQGLEATTVFVDDTEVPVRLVPGGEAISDAADIQSLFIKTGDDQLVPLSSLTSFETVVSAASVSREGGALATAVRSNLGDGVDLSDAVESVRALAANVLPDDTRLTLLGDAAALEDSQSGIYLVFGISLIVVFLVLAAQFESLLSAAIIILTVPFGLVAALLAIKLSGGTLNYYSQIGLIMLIGVMAKNGILIVEFANQLREKGRDIDRAIREAMSLRIRPILMTMMSTILGGLPLILTSGAGSEARIAVGWVIVGGLGFSTLFTLLLTPVFYRLLAGHGATPGAARNTLEREQGMVTAPVNREIRSCS